MDRSTSVNNESATTNSPKGMFDKLKNIFVKKLDIRESRLITTNNNQNRLIGAASESGVHLN